MKPNIKNAIFVDASCIGNPGQMEYRGIDGNTKKVLFHSPTFPVGTNNIGEFLAIVHAIQLCIKNKWDRIIYSDSQTAIQRLQSKKIKTTLEYSDKTKPLLEKLQQALARTKTHEITIPVYKRETESRGEIPADFGRK
ncbi:hypothetical protein KA037_00030 [Patescibacteria group bacterium]|nr:hypothetical protein [Patescibacteria group bacterium]